jgi:cell division septation protein DedD
MVSKPDYFRKEIVIDETSVDSWSRERPEDEQENLQQAEWYNRTANVREESPSWGRVFLSVAAAVGTGALFGYMVLSLFTGEPLFPGKSGTAAQLLAQASSSQTVPSAIAPLASNELNPSDATSAATPVAEENVGNSANSSDAQLQADVYYMLQYGVFQSEESMETAVKQLQEKGLAHASETSDGYRVYVGAARSRDEAELLAAQMPDTEIYIKPIGGEEQSVPSAKISEEGIEFMNASAGMIRKLAQLSAIGLQDKQPQQLGEADLASLDNTHRAWLDKIPAADKLNGKAAEEAEAIVQGIQSAMLSMTEFNSKPSRYHLWNVQSSVMKALLADRHMRSLLQSTT